MLRERQPLSLPLFGSGVSRLEGLLTDINYGVRDMVSLANKQGVDETCIAYGVRFFCFYSGFFFLLLLFSLTNPGSLVLDCLLYEEHVL